MEEITVGIHMHTRYSDGSGSHQDIALAALRSGLDAIVITDHNVWVNGMERYVIRDGKRLLVLVGAEIHDRRRLPQKDHLLVLGARAELAAHADDPAAVISLVRREGGLSFLAHPIDPPAPAFREPDISWENLRLGGFTGIELWNGFSELKARIPTRLHGLFYAYFPNFVARGPFPATIRLWDALLAQRPIVAIGGSDAHALPKRLGPLRRTIFPYEHHFRSINTHVLLERPLSGDSEPDGRSIYAALAGGRCFVGYDRPRSTRGFRFVAYSSDARAEMGGEIAARSGVALHAKVPDYAEIRLLRDGTPIQSISYGQALTYRAMQPGVYRIEAYRRFLGRRRTWILSNPIFVRE